MILTEEESRYLLNVLELKDPRFDSDRLYIGLEMNPTDNTHNVDIVASLNEKFRHAMEVVNDCSFSSNAAEELRLCLSNGEIELHMFLMEQCEVLFQLMMGGGEPVKQHYGLELDHFTVLNGDGFDGRINSTVGLVSKREIEEIDPRCWLARKLSPDAGIKISIPARVKYSFTSLRGSTKCMSY